MNNKTPIMLLQEVSQRMNKLPVYTEIASTCGTLGSQFTIKVEWKNYSIQGKGCSKKEAKQNAAMNMLLLLSSKGEISQNVLSLLPKTESITRNALSVNSVTDITSDTSVSFVNSPVSLSCMTDLNSPIPFVNYVGQIQEYCAIRNIPIPNYSVVSTSGPGHNILFTVSCKLGSIYKEATASTKKAAKQEVAKKIMQDLKENQLIHDIDLGVDITKELEFLNINVDEPKVNSEKVLESYTKLSKKPVIRKSQLCVTEYHLALSCLCNISEIQKKTLGNLDNLNRLRQTISLLLNKSIQTIHFGSNKQYVVGIRVTTEPIIFQIGVGTSKDLAERQAYIKLCHIIIVMNK